MTKRLGPIVLSCLSSACGGESQVWEIQASEYREDYVVRRRIGRAGS